MNPEQYALREMRLAAIAARISGNGFRIHLDLLQERLREGEETRARSMDFLKDFGLPTHDKKRHPYKSPQRTKEGQVAIKNAFLELGGEKFFEKAVKTTAKTGQISTSGDDMDYIVTYTQNNWDKAVAAGYNPQGIISLAETIKQLSGIRTVYQTVETHRVGDRVYPEISMKQASGRWSTTDPGLTVMGKRGGRSREREIFLADPGHVMVCVDLDQVDMRVVAAHCQDEEYLKMFGPGRDPHTETAIAIWGDPSRREDAKPCNHGWNYGMGPRKLIEHYGMAPKIAYEYDQGMKDRFGKLVFWQNDVRERVKNGELIDNGFGRKMRAHPMFAWTEGPAQVGQGGTRDILAEGFLSLPLEIMPYIRAAIHDEGAFSVPEDRVDEITETILEAFQRDFKPWFLPDAIPVAITAGTSKVAENWGSCYSK